MPPSPASVSLQDSQFESFDVLNFGAISVPAKPSRFGFQLDVSPSSELRQVAFGLVQKDESYAAGKRVGFGVRIDLERGEIWDIVNGSGLIGWVESPLGSNGEGKPESFLLSLEIERLGSALLPKLQVGGEEWLYPAVRSLDELELIAVAGCDGDAVSETTLTKPTIWWDHP
jgi:hypothetical protein